MTAATGVRPQRRPVARTRTRFALGALAALAIGGTAACSSSGSAPVAAQGTPTPTPSPTHSAHAKPPECPLTGRPARSKAAAHAPALAVKIDNIGPARPQAGLNAADVVVQEQVEGGLTRLFAVFQCHSAARVGPIRSARTTDADLLALLHHSAFAYSGANPRVMPPIRKVGHTVLLSWDQTPGRFRLDSSRPAPHDVFGSTVSLLKAARAQRGHAIPPPVPWFRYGPLTQHGRRIHAVSMAWPGATAAWSWNRSRWKRNQDGTPDVLAGGDRVTATNVVVMSVHLRDTGIRDVAGNPSPDDVVTGSGRVWVLRGGRIVPGTWKRRGVTHPWTFRDRRGRLIRLAPGRTWVELLSDPKTLSTH